MKEAIFSSAALFSFASASVSPPEAAAKRQPPKWPGQMRQVCCSAPRLEEAPCASSSSARPAAPPEQPQPCSPDSSRRSSRRSRRHEARSDPRLLHAALRGVSRLLLPQPQIGAGPGVHRGRGGGGQGAGAAPPARQRQWHPRAPCLRWGGPGESLGPVAPQQRGAAARATDQRGQCGLPGALLQSEEEPPLHLLPGAHRAAPGLQDILRPPGHQRQEPQEGCGQDPVRRLRDEGERGRG
ncbi:cyclic GMP-AMP synthase-like isoform X2 [Mauremys mutica]|uniref:cyclic GMP-AMP synthase-like isoform X2 n=1 Tax=Mauremys mutica TaxID=74926 RepID=UPI001D1621AC|nr:cyclic GMP-AMP synthase-like isoform X2 [Mauremys mutica]